MNRPTVIMCETYPNMDMFHTELLHVCMFFFQNITWISCFLLLYANKHFIANVENGFVMERPMSVKFVHTKQIWLTILDILWYICWDGNPILLDHPGYLYKHSTKHCLWDLEYTYKQFIGNIICDANLRQRWTSLKASTKHSGGLMGGWIRTQIAFKVKLNALIYFKFYI